MLEREGKVVKANIKSDKNKIKKASYVKKLKLTASLKKMRYK